MSNDDSALGASAPETTSIDTGNAGPETQQTDNNGDNPAWKGLMDAMPSSLHGQIRPHLQEWDRGVQQRFQQVQSQYAPYKQFLDGGISADDLIRGQQLMQLIATDPRTFYDRMTAHYSEEWGLNGNGDQGQSGNEEDNFGDFGDPEDQQDNPFAKELAAARQEIEQMRGNQDTMAQYMASQVQQRYEQEADQQVEQEFNAVVEKYGELDQPKVNLIVSLALQNDMTVADAADQVFAMLGTQTPQPPPPPRVVSTTGGTPTAPPINPGNLSGRERRSLVASILQQNNANTEG